MEAGKTAKQCVDSVLHSYAREAVIEENRYRKGKGFVMTLASKHSRLKHEMKSSRCGTGLIFLKPKKKIS